MPKRSLVNQLDQAIDAMLARPGAARPQVDASLDPLLQIAAQLRDLPREEFKARLKSQLGGKPVATVAEPRQMLKQTATVRLRVKDAAAAIEFYKRAFGARETMRFVVGDGKIAHAEISIGNSAITLAEESPSYPGPQMLGGSPVVVELFVDDADALFQQALSAGAKVFSPVQDHFYGDRSGQVTDPFGYTWTVAMHKEDMSVEEMHRRFEAMTKQAESKEPRVNPIRPGFRTVTPYMVAPDGAALLEFAKNVFGAEEMFRSIGSAGGIHGEVRIGDSMLMMGGGIPGKAFHALPNTTALHIYVRDCDAAYARALASGATSIDPPADQFYGERSASVKDFAGNFWYIATYKGDNYKWEGAPDIQPCMHPLRAETVMNFLKRAFGAEELGRHASPDGVIHHATVKIGTSLLEFGDAHGPYQPMKSMFYMYVPDVDTVYRQALAAGAKSISEPADQPYGDRNAGIEDPFGNQWYIATHVKNVAS
jgi:PhnB protein